MITSTTTHDFDRAVLLHLRTSWDRATYEVNHGNRDARPRVAKATFERAAYAYQAKWGGS